MLRQRLPLWGAETGSLEVRHPRLVAEIRRRRRVRKRLRLRDVRLELHGVGAGIRGSVNETDCIAERPVVNRAELGDDADHSGAPVAAILSIAAFCVANAATVIFPLGSKIR